MALCGVTEFTKPQICLENLLNMFYKLQKMKQNVAFKLIIAHI